MNLSAYLESLRLNMYEKEAIIYLSSVHSADARSVHKNTNIPLGRIYSVMQELRSKGLLNVIPTSPKRFRIGDVKQSLKNYLKKQKEILNSQYNVIEKLDIKPKMPESSKVESSAIVLNGRNEHLNTIISLRENSKRQLLQIAPLFKGNTSSRISIRRAINRGVKIKIIVKNVNDDNRRNIEYALKYGAEIRVLDSPEPFSLLIKDSDEILFGVQDTKKHEERMVIWSRNAHLIGAMKSTFSNLWEISKSLKNVKD